MQPMFTPGAIYNSPTHGIVEFKGMDNYMGQTTFKFRSHTYNTDCYWLPGALHQHLDLTVPNAPGKPTAANEPNEG